MAQPSPIQSWNRTFPCVVSAAKSGAESLMRSDMANSSLKVLAEGGTRSIMLDGLVLSCQGFPIFPAPFPTGEAVSQSLPALTNNRGTLGNLSHANQVARGGGWSRLSRAPDGRRRRRLEGYSRGFPDPARAGPRPSLDLLRQRRDIAEAAGGAGCAAELLRT